MSIARSSLLQSVTCPHCWHEFPPHQTLWVAAHPSLIGDPRLGPEQPLRFLPTRFFPNGSARDEMGTSCSQLACPRCHLLLPRLTLELKPWFASIIGAPGCGKSYFLTAMSWALRRRLSEWFHLAFADIDAEFNQILAGYEQQLFSNQQPQRAIPLASLIEKTKEQGDFYNTVLVDGQSVQWPRPFLYSLRPIRKEDDGERREKSSRLICLYDNAGESFLPGRESALRPVTMHLAKSAVHLFLFDPTQHAPFRRSFEDLGASEGAVNIPILPPRQDLVLLEMANRTRRHSGISEMNKWDRPLIVIVTKSDLWAGKLLPGGLPKGPSVVANRKGECMIDLEFVEQASAAIRKLLLKFAPEMVTAAEAFSSAVVYMSVSSLGAVPERDLQTGQLTIRPDDIHPQDAELPLLFGLAKTVPGLIPLGRRKPLQPNPSGERLF